MKKTTLQLETLACPSCMAKVEGAIKNVPGIDVDNIKVLFNASKVKFDFDETKISVETVTEAVEKIGYEVLKANVK